MGGLGVLLTTDVGRKLPHACQSFSKLKIDGAHRQHTANFS